MTLHCDLGALLVLCDTVNVVFLEWSVLLVSEGVAPTVSSNVPIFLYTKLKKVVYCIVALCIAALCIAYCCIPRPQSTMDVTNF